MRRSSIIAIVVSIVYMEVIDPLRQWSKVPGLFITITAPSFPVSIEVKSKTLL